jgi:hypothetical protein
LKGSTTASVSCTIGILARGSFARVTLEVAAVPGFVGVVNSSATVTVADSHDPRPNNDSDSVSTQLGVGVFHLSHARTVAHPGDAFVLELTWTAPRRWRDLKTVELELVDRSRVVGLVRFVQDGSTTGRLDLGGPTGKPGEQRTLTRGPLTLLLGRSSVHGSGPAGKSVTLNLALRAGTGLAGRSMRLLVGATDVNGTRQPFASAGSVTVRR